MLISFHALSLSRFPVQIQSRARRRERGFTTSALPLFLLFTSYGVYNFFVNIMPRFLPDPPVAESQEARTVAFAGMKNIMAELSRPENAAKLFSVKSPAAWGKQPPEDGWLKGSCAPTPSRSGQPGDMPTEGSPVLTSTFINLLSGDYSRRYRLRSLRFSGEDRNIWISRTLHDDGTQQVDGTGSLASVIPGHPSPEGREEKRFVRLEVEGVHYVHGRLAGSATVSREFVLTPGCCRTAPGGAENAAGGEGDGARGADGSPCFDATLARGS